MLKQLYITRMKHKVWMSVKSFFCLPADMKGIGLSIVRDITKKRRPKEPEVLWQAPKLRAGYCTPIAHEGRIYVVAGSGVVNCADARTGEILWTQRLDAGGAYAASPLLADGKLYVVNEAGVTTVLQVGKTAKVLATNPLNDVILASPVASDGAIFLRSDAALYCIGAKK